MLVNNQLVCLLPVGILNLVTCMFIGIFIYHCLFHWSLKAERATSSAECIFWLPKKITIEFSILVPCNFMPSVNPKREVIWYHCFPSKNGKIIAQNFNSVSLHSTQPCLNDIYNTWAFVGGFLRTLIYRVQN